MKSSLKMCLKVSILFFALSIIVGQNFVYATTGDVQTPAPATGDVQTPVPVQTGQPTTATFTLTNPLTGINSIGALVQNFVQIFSYVVILFAVLMFIYTGLQYVTAQGNSAKIKDLHAKLLYIVIGVAVVIGARVIIDVVINTLSTTGAVNSNVIQQARNANSGN